VRILVIEDEARILRFVASGLEAEGFGVVCARDGQDGLERALQESVDLVVLDLLLPRLDGLSLLRTLRLHQPELPVVILSARSDLQTKLLGFEFGANDYLAKPFSFDEFLARVRAQLRPPGRRPPTSCTQASSRSTSTTGKSGSGAPSLTSPSASSDCCATSSSTPARS
jgi:DNA-binding response OmpR family regulator